MRRFIIIFWTLFLVGYSAISQSVINGQVVSEINYQKPNVAVYVFENGTNNGVLTDSLGYFKVITENKGDVHLFEVSAVGYLKTVFKIDLRDKPLNNTFVLKAECSINGKKAIEDLKAGNAKLYLIGGIVPVANSDSDNKFEEKYGIKYFDFGCEPSIHECIMEYNQIVAKYLDQKYGVKWRKKSRTDIILK